MKLHILTIAYNAMPFLPIQLATLNRCSEDWIWHIIEGPAANVGSTKWCRTLTPGRSTDGTAEFMDMLQGHPRIHTGWKKYWSGGKDEMCNYALRFINEPCVLLQMDADEIWDARQLSAIVQLFSPRNQFNCARFRCRYFVGHNLITTGPESGYYGNNPGEWLRAWRFTPGMTFKSHEPPALTGINEKADGWENCASADFTSLWVGTFDHHSWVYPAHVAFKEQFYGYTNALAQWEKLQDYDGPFPAQLKRFLPWVDDKAQVVQLFS